MTTSNTGNYAKVHKSFMKFGGKKAKNLNKFEYLLENKKK